MGPLMARKNLLKGLMGDAPPAPDDPAEAPRPRYSKGAIGAVGQSIADLKSRAINDIDPASIVDGGIRDRLEHDAEAHASLVASIRDYGQQVPVLLRPHPQEAGRFEVVYGRRRVQAIRDLGQTVKAMIRDLDDREAVVAQGQENSARRDLSFIEKANFARQMREAGYERRIICDALHIDKTIISRMLSVVNRVPIAIIEAIGAAPSIGRDRWLQLADLIEQNPERVKQHPALFGPARVETSDARFEALFASVTPRAVRAPSRVNVAPIRFGEEPTRGQIKRTSSAVTLSFDLGRSDGFDEWLVENLEEIHRDWQARRDE